MTRKRLRYSELSPPPSAPEENVPAPAADLEALVVERDDDEPLIGATDDQATPIEPPIALVEASLPQAKTDATAAMPDVATDIAPRPTPRRNSTPVELARTLTAERAAARAAGEIPDEPNDRGAVPSFEHEVEPQRTMRERARMRSGTAELLMFLVGGERFAVELILVDEVIDLPVIHHVPEMPPAMLGVVTVRGSLTPVYSPQRALGRPLAQRDALLIFRRGSHRVGILIDDVDDALSADMGELREKPVGEEGDNVLLGVMRLENTLVGIVDADALITSCQSANILEPA